jgi:MFS family permease
MLSLQGNHLEHSFPTMLMPENRLWLSLFLSALDTTIVTTGLIRISSDFEALGQAAWLITAYLLTYNGTLPSYAIGGRGLT